MIRVRALRRVLATVALALVATTAIALEPAPREWLVDLSGPEGGFAGGLLPGTRPVVDAEGNSYVLVASAGTEWSWGLLLGASYDPAGALRWRRRLGTEIDEQVPGGVAKQWPDGTTVWAGGDWDALAAASYGPDGGLLWSVERAPAEGYSWARVYDVGPGPDGGIWVIAAEENLADRSLRYTAVSLFGDGSVGAAVELPSLADRLRDDPLRILGAYGGQVYLLEAASWGSSASPRLSALRADGSERWQSSVFTDPGRSAWIFEVELGADGRLAVLGRGADWNIQPAGAAPPPLPIEGLFEPDEWLMVAVAILGPDGGREAVAYEALPGRQDLLGHEVRFAPDGGILVGATIDDGPRYRSSYRATVLAYDRDLVRVWRQDSWLASERAEVTLAPLAGGDVALATPICQGAECRLLVAEIEAEGRVAWSTLGGAVAPNDLSEDSLLRSTASGGDLWIAHLRATERGTAGFALARYAAPGVEAWSAGLPFERPLSSYGASGLAPDGAGGVVLSASASYEPRLMQVGPDGSAGATIETPEWFRTTSLGAMPEGGVIAVGTSEREPFPTPDNVDFTISRVGPELVEQWRTYAKGPGSRIDEAQSLAVGPDRACLSGSSQWPAPFREGAAHAVCWNLEGELLWSRAINAPAADNYWSALALSPAGDLAVAAGGYWGSGLDLVVFDDDGRPKWGGPGASRLTDWSRVAPLGLAFSSNGDLIAAVASRQDSDRTGVFAFGPDGDLLWQWDPRPVAWGPLTQGFAVAGERVFVGGCYQQWYGGAQEPFVAALDADGELLWLRSLPGPAQCQWFRLAVDACGRVLTASATGVHRVDIAAFSNAGDPLWADAVEQPGTLLPWAIATDGVGGAWVEMGEEGALDRVVLARYRAGCAPAP